MSKNEALSCDEGFRKIQGKCKQIVIFRKFKDNDVIALFPDSKADMEGNCESYMHIGQHGAADYYGLLSITKLASKKDFSKLLQELHSIGYKKSELAIRKKWMRD